MNIFVKNWFGAVFFGLSACALLACANKQPVSAWGAAANPYQQAQWPVNPHHATAAHNQQEPPPKHAFGNYFDVRDRHSYQRLLEHCRRCGTKRLHSDGSYERIWTFSLFGSGESPKQCDNWLSKGYIQIEFLEDSLPARVEVRVNPGYMNRGSSQVRWGAAFSAVSTAHPINEDEGFQIIVRPQDGLGGGGSLNIESERSNHINNNPLSVSVSYGSQSQGAETFKADLVRLSKRAIPKPRFGCNTYTN